MIFRGRHLIRGAIATTFVCLVGTVLSARQAAAPQQPPMAENVYLDVQVLKGIPVDRFNDTMGMFASALLLDCVGCHDGRITSDPKAFALPTPRILRARQMVVMMNNLNRMYFGGQQRITCFTCHNGDPQPERSPSLRLQYQRAPERPLVFQIFSRRGGSARGENTRALHPGRRRCSATCRAHQLFGDRHLPWL